METNPPVLLYVIILMSGFMMDNNRETAKSEKARRKFSPSLREK